MSLIYLNVQNASVISVSLSFIRFLLHVAAENIKLLFIQVQNDCRVIRTEPLK